MNIKFCLNVSSRFLKKEETLFKSTLDK